MSILDWYDHKAEQCMRQAQEATDAQRRATFKQEAVLWREIGADISRQDKKETIARGKQVT
jgi:hypothetical protein